MIIDGNQLADTLMHSLAERVQALEAQNVTPTLGVVLVGTDGPSQTYVRKKSEAAASIGMECFVRRFPEEVTTEELIEAVQKYQQPEFHLHGLIVQLPLPAHVDTDAVLNAIDPRIDVDCLTRASLGALVDGSPRLLPPTPAGMLHIARSQGAELNGANVVVVGAGRLVGRPLTNMLMHEGASVTVLQRSSTNSVQAIQQADIVFSGVGSPWMITGEMIQQDALVIDAGVTIVDGESVGDVDVASVEPVARAVTPTPGGTGPLTVTMLLQNTIIVAEEQISL